MVQRHLRRPQPLPRPFSFNLADPFSDQRVVKPVGAAMQRQADAQHGLIIRWQQQAVVSKVVETEAIPAERIEQAHQPPVTQQLPRQEVMALQTRVETRMPLPVDGAEGQPATTSAGQGTGQERHADRRQSLHTRT